MKLRDEIWGTTKSSMKRDFTYARHLIRLIEQAIQNEESIEDWSEAGDLGQTINELVAIVSNASAYREGRQQFLNNLEVGA
jgi:nucleoside-diphosphate-sugar epimerase